MQGRIATRCFEAPIHLATRCDNGVWTGVARWLAFTLMQGTRARRRIYRRTLINWPAASDRLHCIPLSIVARLFVSASRAAKVAAAEEPRDEPFVAKEPIRALFVAAVAPLREVECHRAPDSGVFVSSSHSRARKSKVYYMKSMDVRREVWNHFRRKMYLPVFKTNFQSA